MFCSVSVVESAVACVVFGLGRPSLPVLLPVELALPCITPKSRRFSIGYAIRPPFQEEGLLLLKQLLSKEQGLLRLRPVR